MNQFYWFLFVLFFVSIRASSGDAARSFTKCLDHCKNFFLHKYTDDEEYHFFMPNIVTFHLFQWSEEDECKYQCMHHCESQSAKKRQYYGKWAFLRIAGMQEFFSVLFSLANLYSHRTGYERSKKILRSEPMYKYYFYTSCATWISSAIFHSRDTKLTEFLDYSCAFASVLFALYIAIIRIFLFKTKVPVLATAVKFTLFTIWAAHYYRMIMVTFDYSLNMKLNLAAGIIHNCLWVFWAISSPRAGKQQKRQILVFCIAISLFANFEIFDFPPILGLIDSHGLWHASTAVLVLLYWSFLKDEFQASLGVQLLKDKETRGQLG